MNPPLAIAVCLVSGYLIGSPSGSLMLGRLRGVDIRTLGSGNAGGTNAFRTQGFAFAAGVMLVDVGKAALASALAWRLASQLEIPALTAATAAATGVFVGHVWPIFHGFRGGKGAATVIGSLLVLWPQGALIGLLTWLPVLVVGGWVSLATLCAAFALVLASLLLAPVISQPQLSLYLGFVAAAMLWTHRANLVRLRTGSEHRFERAQLLRGRRDS